MPRRVRTRLALLTAFLLLFCACTGEQPAPVVDPAAEEAPAETAESEPSTDEDIVLTQRTSRWDNRQESYGNLPAVREMFAITSYPDNPPDPFTDMELDVESAVQIGEPGEDDILVTLIYRYTDTTIRVYELSDANGDPYFPDTGEEPVVGEMVYEGIDPEGFQLLRLPVLVDRESRSYPRYGYSYRVEAQRGDKVNFLYPYSPEMRDTYRFGGDMYHYMYYDYLGDLDRATGGSGRGLEEILPLLELKEEEETPAADLEAETEAEIISFPAQPDYAVERMDRDGTQELLDALGGSEALVRITDEYRAQRGLPAADDSEIRGYIDSDGTRFVIVMRTLPSGETVQYPVIADARGEPRVVGQSEAPFPLDNCRFYRLPQSDYCLLLDSDDSVSLVVADRSLPGWPILRDEGDVDWLCDQIPDPDREGRFLLFGVTGRSPYSDKEEITPQLVAFVRNEDGFTHWLRAGSATGYNGDSFVSLLNYAVTGGTSDTMFGNPQPWEADFRTAEGEVEVLFPETYTTLLFDFVNFRIVYSTDYDETLLTRSGSSYQGSSPDGRYELWQIHLRTYHESHSYYDAVYDTLTGRVHDFDLNLDTRVSFLDDGHVALVRTERLDNDADGYQSYEDSLRASSRERITIYDLATGERRAAALDLGELAWAHYVYGAVRDDSRGRQYVITTARVLPDDTELNYVNLDPEENFYAGEQYMLSIFDAQGRYLRTYQTGIYPFGGKFIRYQPQMQVLEDGRVLISNPYGSEDNYLFDPVDEEIEQVTYSLPRELETALRTFYYGQQTDPENAYSTAVGTVLRRGSSHEDGEAVFELLLDLAEREPEQAWEVGLLRIGRDSLYTAEGYLWYLRDDTEPGEEGARIGSLHVAGNYDQPPMTWTLSDGTAYLVFQNSTQISLIRWEPDSSEPFRAVEKELYGMLPLYLTLSQSAIQTIHEEWFILLHAEPEGDQLNLFYFNQELGEDRPLARVIREDDLLVILYPEVETTSDAV